MVAKKQAAKPKKITDKNVGKRTVKARRVFQKEMHLVLTGTSKAAIQRVAAKIHATSTDETTGGKEERQVQITGDSSDTRQVFFGNI